jgi:branched-chain amino acid transport system substrate-binding protein
MTSPVRKATIGIFAAAFALAVTGSTIAPAAAADPGITDTEILLGGTHPYSGPASAYGNIGKGITAYFS